jgi:SAM-dependent methyltransferase
VRNVGSTLSSAWHFVNRNASRFFPGGRLARYYRRRQFRYVYEHSSWGNDPGSKYFSGVGSAGAAGRTYVEVMSPILAGIAENSDSQITIVDLGCGDFRVGSELLKRLPDVRYIGCDIVPELVEENTRRFGSDRIQFRCLDVVSQKLPVGQVYLVRQVFQHLPNLDIAIVLAKLAASPHVFVTEGQPEVQEGPRNPDKQAGAAVRFDWKLGRGRGVELDQPPFNVPIKEICRVATDPQVCREVIVTWALCFPSVQV